MAATQKRSLSDMRPTSPASISTSHDPQHDNQTYRMMVLRFDQPEEEVDRNFLQKALELGINIPQDPKTTLDLITNNVSTLNIGTAPQAIPEHPSHLDSRASQSIHTPSDSSIESKGHRKTPSLAATSITSAPSTDSVSSHKSNYVKFKRGFKRFSTMRGRRKTLAIQPSSPDLPIRPATTHLIRPDLQQRSNTADQIMTISLPQQQSLASPTSPNFPRSPTGRPTGRRKVISMPYGIPPPPPPPPPQSRPSHPPPPSPSSIPPRPSTSGHTFPISYQPASDPTAITRSLTSPTLKKLRTTQLQEQLRFISFRASQTRLLRTAHLARKRAALTAYKTTQSDTESRHAEALASLEHRHLSAEVDLHKALETERQACDVRLKHMQAYCNPRDNVAGMPVRTVTNADFKKLEQQYHVRNGMDNLHASRINVLRERQAKQVERVVDKQEKEMEKQAAEFDEEQMELEEGARAEEMEMERVFRERKHRLVNRWQMAEAIEKRLLELETGEIFAELPPIGWGDEGRDGEEVDAEVQRLLAVRRIAVDPASGIMMMEEEEREDGDAEGVGVLVEGKGEFDPENVI